MSDSLSVVADVLEEDSTPVFVAGDLSARIDTRPTFTISNVLIDCGRTLQSVVEEGRLDYFEHRASDAFRRSRRGEKYYAHLRFDRPDRDNDLLIERILRTPLAQCDCHDIEVAVGLALCEEYDWSFPVLFGGAVFVGQKDHCMRGVIVRRLGKKRRIDLEILQEKLVHRPLKGLVIATMTARYSRPMGT